MRYRPIPAAWKRDLEHREAVKIVLDELTRVRREIDRKEGMVAGLELALEIVRQNLSSDAEAVRRLA